MRSNDDHRQSIIANSFDEKFPFNPMDYELWADDIMNNYFRFKLYFVNKENLENKNKFSIISNVNAERCSHQ